ncbi:spartin a isoform X1 [Alosa sapidissima]|uniref:spartin a isoform X1 n=1 Tax=Alosa sapidissima TaxID=34773 RepID=UPI001C0803AD|nr:spartin a isoform X1 [Alosa sapidissima]
MDTAEVNLQVINTHYQRAFDCLNTGLSEDEAGRKATALMFYRLGRQHLLQGLEVSTHGETCVGAAWESARQMQLKMNETLSTITTRLAILETTPTQENAGAQTQHLYPALPILQTDSTRSATAVPVRSLYPNLPRIEEPASPGAVLSDNLLGAGEVSSLPVSPVMVLGVPGDQPPAYTPQPSDGHLSLSHGTDKEVMSAQDDWELVDRPQVTQSQEINGEELFYLAQGVQIFFVAADGQVSAPSYPGFLRIIVCTRNQHTDPSLGHPPAYLQVCNWLYPLYSDLPVLLSNTGVFTFPDTTASTPGSYVGVVLSSGLPASDRARFHQHLSQLTLLRVQTADENAAVEAIDLGEKIPIGHAAEGKTLPEWSDKLAQNILAGASWLGRGLVKGGNYAGKAIQKGASSLRDHMTPREVPAEVSPKVSKGLNATKEATGGAVKVSQFIVDGIATVADKVGKELAPHVKKHGSKLIPESLKKNKDGHSNIDGALMVASSSLQGLSTVWTSMETAAKNIGKSLASETVQTVRHKYGDDAGKAADTTVKSVVNVGIAAYNIDNIGIKAALKTTGKQTAKAMVKEGDGEKQKGDEYNKANSQGK